MKIRYDKPQKLFITLLIMISPFMLLAQGGPPGTPIDGGLGALLTGGLLYGVSRIKKLRK